MALQLSRTNGRSFTEQDELKHSVSDRLHYVSTHHFVANSRLANPKFQSESACPLQVIDFPRLVNFLGIERSYAEESALKSFRRSRT